MCKTIKQKVNFNAPPAEVYKLLADSKLHSKITRHKADISTTVGGKFSTFNGAIKGINVDLVPGKRIVQAWRAKGFPEGVYSMAAITLAPTKAGGTELVLTHRGVPKAMIPEVERGWRKAYWAKIKAYLNS